MIEHNTHLGLISIAGIIGSGKTTLARQLANLLPAQLILEEFDLNPFLPRQVKGDAMAALPSELFFLLSRAKQLCPEHLHPQKALNLNSGFTAVSDYIFEKNLIFAQLFLDERRFDIFREVEASVMPVITSPSLVIYLIDTVENCLSRIHERGRDFEKSITPAFLAKLDEAYNELFGTWNSSPVLRIHCEDFDFRREASCREIMGAIYRQALCVPESCAERSETE